MTTHRGLRLASAAVVVASFSSIAAGCGLSTSDDSFSPIPTDEIPFGLNATSTSTTTTTTTTTTVLDAPPTIPSTTTIPIRQEPIEVYFLTRGRLQPVVIDLPAGVSPDQVADVLEDGPPTGVALDTLIEDGLIVNSNETGGVLTVDLDPEMFDRIPSTQQTEAIAQIVLTMLSSVRRLGQVTFTLGGEPIAVKKGDSLLSEVGEPLSYDDYAMLLVTQPATADTTTTTTTTRPTDTTLVP